MKNTPNKKEKVITVSLAESFLAKHKLKFMVDLLFYYQNDLSDFSYPSLKVHHFKIAEMVGMDKNTVQYILQTIFSETSQLIATLDMSIIDL